MIVNSLAVQWSGLHASTAGGTGLIPGWGTKIPQKTTTTETLKSKRINDKAHSRPLGNSKNGCHPLSSQHS